MDLSKEKNSETKKEINSIINYYEKPKENLYEKLHNTLFNLKFKYKNIEEITNSGDYNFYGIIYDASLPLVEEYPPEDEDLEPIFKYTCDIKIIDHVSNFLTEPENIFKNMITITITTDHKDYIPFITKIGEIIRIHHGIYKQIKSKTNESNNENIIPEKKLSLTLNKKTKYKGNWCIFEPKKAIEPYYFSHSRYPYELQDKKIVEYFRDYLPKYLSLKNSLIYPNEILLINRFEKKEKCESIVYIIKKIELNDRYIFFILDESDACELHAHQEFEYLKENDVVRINDYKVINEKVIVLSDIGNVLIFPEVSFNKKFFMNKLKDKFKSVFGKEVNKSEEKEQDNDNDNDIQNKNKMEIDI